MFKDWMDLTTWDLLILTTEPLDPGQRSGRQARFYNPPPHLNWGVSSLPRPHIYIDESEKNTVTVLHL